MVTRDEVVDEARDLIAPVFGTALYSTVIGKLLVLETLHDVREIRSLLQRS